MSAIYEEREFVEVGGLMAYEADFIEMCQRSAHDIGAILLGVKPADIPYYQATKFDLTINLKTARALGLAVSQLLLARANEVIE
jgi:putative ABC transport system substrate-binding protein